MNAEENTPKNTVENAEMQGGKEVQTPNHLNFSVEPSSIFSQKKRFSDRVKEFFEFSKRQVEALEKQKKVLVPLFLGILTLGGLSVLEEKSAFVSASLSFLASMMH